MLTAKQITAVQKEYWIDAFLYMVPMHGIKISILLMYIRIFPPEAVSRWFILVCWITMAALTASGVALCVSNAVACNPVAYNWSVSPTLLPNLQHTQPC